SIPVAALAGFGAAGEPTAVPTGAFEIDTLSTTAVVSDVVTWLVTAMPARGLEDPAIDVVPTVVHVLPSVETALVTTPPARESRSQPGKPTVVPPRYVVAPFTAERCMNSTLPSGLISRMTCGEPADVVSRSMTPALAYGLVFCRLVTRATIW